MTAPAISLAVSSVELIKVVLMAVVNVVAVVVAIVWVIAHGTSFVRRGVVCRCTGRDHPDGSCPLVHICSAGQSVGGGGGGGRCGRRL
jgi:hypothetical protein